jgi:hypothetical protein
VPYRANQPDALAALRAAGWPAYEESDFGAVVRRIRAAVGDGPVAEVAFDRRETSVAPALALAALAPLLALLALPGRIPSLTSRQRTLRRS